MTRLSIPPVLFAAALLLSLMPVSAGEGFADIFGPEDDMPEQVDQAFDSDFDFGGTASPADSIFSGEAGLELKSYFDDGYDSELTALPYLALNINPVSGDLEAMARFMINPVLMTDEPVWELIDELYISYFFSAGYLQAGLMKIEWGKGDGIHVLDPINPINQTDGIYTDINVMKDPVSMVKLNLYAGAEGLLELIYIPIYNGYTIADEGRWALIDPDSLPGLTEEDMTGISHSTGALRYSTTLGAFDLGAVYYYGYRPEPGYKIDILFTGGDPLDSANYTTSTTRLYTQAHLFGLEAGWASGPFTFRTEAGYWLTEDTGGTEPEYYNNSVVFLGGFDLTIPGTNIFFSLQATGSLVLNYEDLTETDVDYLAAYNDRATTTNIIPAIEWPFAGEKLKLRQSGIYLVEAGGWMSSTELFWYPADDLEISLAGQFFGGEKECHYRTWEENGNISLEFSYTF